MRCTAGWPATRPGWSAGSSTPPPPRRSPTPRSSPASTCSRATPSSPPPSANATGPGHQAGNVLRGLGERGVPPRPAGERVGVRGVHSALPAACALLAFLLYLKTAARTITWAHGGADGAELTAVAY